MLQISIAADGFEIQKIALCVSGKVKKLKNKLMNLQLNEYTLPSIAQISEKNCPAVSLFITLMEMRTLFILIKL